MFKYDKIFSESVHSIVFFQILDAIEIDIYTIDVIIFTKIPLIEKCVISIICNYNGNRKFNKVPKALQVTTKFFHRIIIF